MSVFEHGKRISGDIPTANFVLLQRLIIKCGLNKELEWVYPRKYISCPLLTPRMPPVVGFSLTDLGKVRENHPLCSYLSEKCISGGIPTADFVLLLHLFINSSLDK